MVIFNCYVWLEGFCGHFHPCLACFDVIPSGKLSHNYGKSPFFHEIPISQVKWWFSTVMTVYQRVTCSFFRCPNSLLRSEGPQRPWPNASTRPWRVEAGSWWRTSGGRTGRRRGCRGGRTAWCLGNPWETFWVIPWLSQQIKYVILSY